MRPRCSRLLMGAALLAGMVAPVLAADVTSSVTATANATVRPSGPRTGTSGQRFFNVEGSANGTNASYGVLRFDTAPLLSEFDTQFGPGAYTLTGIDLQLIESNAAFTFPGTINFAFSPDNAMDISPANTALIYDAANPLPSHQFAQSFISTGAFTTQGNTNTGQVDTYSLLAANEGGTQLSNAILGGGIITLVVNDGDPTVAATWAGMTNTLGGPKLAVRASGTVIPEPSSLLLLAGGLPALLAFRRKR